ncbi:MAG: prolipoprotein diacylglyceryl transferase family protein [Polyangiaceae bacterium]
MRPRVVALLQPYLGTWLSSWVVPGYAAMLTIGCVLGAVLVVEAARKIGVRAADTLAVLIATYVGGIVGASSVPVIQGLALLVQTGSFAIPTGMHAYGGLIGGLVAGVIRLRQLNIAVAPFLDEVAPTIGVGYFFGRIGCFLAGCDYGKPLDSSFAVQFPRGSHAFNDHLQRGWITSDAVGSLPVHPTQLYHCAIGLVIYVVASAIPSKHDGRRYACVVVGYGALRSFVEVFRGDASRGAVGPLSTSQAIALVTSLMAMAYLVRVTLKTKPLVTEKSRDPE